MVRADLPSGPGRRSKKSEGSVVFVSGSAAFDPKPAFAAVAATNAAIIALAKAFAEQGIKDGVQVNRKGQHQPLRTTGRDCRAPCVHRFPSLQVDDGNLSTDGRRGDQRDLNSV